MTTKSKARSTAPAAKAPSPASASETPVATPPPPVEPKSLGGKLGTLAELLRRADGASIAQLADATGWQAHSVRGAMAGALKKRGLVVTSEKTDAGRVYRLPAASEAQS